MESIKTYYYWFGISFIWFLISVSMISKQEKNALIVLIASIVILMSSITIKHQDYLIELQNIIIDGRINRGLK